MIKEVNYSGYTASPSDYECADGQLALSLNLLAEDGHIKPLPQPAVSDIGLLPSQHAVHIHRPSNRTHYIVQQGNQLYWTDANDSEHSLTYLNDIPASTEIYQVSSIGNTLVVLRSDGIHYFLWKGEQSAYIALGTKIPECKMSFGLQGEMKRSDSFKINFNIEVPNIYEEFDDTQKTLITDQVLAKVNKFIAEESVQKGKFIFPFFVRYAYRLYDGSLTMHSAPILMICSSDLTPRVFWDIISHEGPTYTEAELQVVAPVHSLDYACQTPTSTLSQWSDIVKSVDIFISQPIYTYDQNGQCERFSNGQSASYGFSVCKHVNQAASTTTYPLRYQKNDFGKMYAFTFTPDSLSTRPGAVLHIPRRSADAVSADIRDCSQFYFLHTIRIEDLKSERTVIPVKDDYLQSLVARELMTDDYDSHDRLIAEQAFPYNARLNISGLRKQLFNGFDGYSLFNHSDGFVYHPTQEGASPTLYNTPRSVYAYVYIKQDGRDIIVKAESGICGYQAPLLFFYYPNRNAYKAVIVRRTSFNDPLLVIPLEPHGSLNGAFYFNGWEEVAGIEQSEPPQSSSNQLTIEIPNKIYTSEVNNPFFFPLLGINTIGTGKIFGISTAAKALSAGQFGQFPLYAFTSEGVWALEVSATGSYSAKQPITRDVCTNPDSITQIDSAVLFATDRGIMLISGSTTQCLSDVINSDSPFDVTSLRSLPDIHSFMGHDSDDSCIPTAPFSKFLSGCGMLYDYIHQRIIVFNKSFSYAYVYSLKSNCWGMMHSSIEAAINSYPEALAVDHDGKLLNFSAIDNIAPQMGLLVTRPLKLDLPDVLKTVDTVIQRGRFTRGHVMSVLYGSRDLDNWFPVWSSTDHFLRGFRGTPYKFYRIVCLTNLADNESIFGASIQFNPRLADQPR